MPLDLLDTPLRITWDLHGSGGPLFGDKALRVATALAEGGVFFATLGGSPLLHSAISDIIHRLSAGGIQVQMVIRGEEEAARLSPGLPLNALFLDLHPFLSVQKGFPAIAAVVEQVRAQGYEPSFWLVPQRSTLFFLPALFAFAREYRPARIKLPNTPVDGTFSLSKGLLPHPEDLEKLRRLLGDDPRSLHEGLPLEVHDLFLWELLFPDGGEGRSEYGGCQAANSLAHVDAGGDIHPCSSWPHRLGSLVDQDLAEIWEGSERHVIRSMIDAAPSGCAGCHEYASCFGGCRGLGRLSPPEKGGRDPLCGGPRTNDGL